MKYNPFLGMRRESAGLADSLVLKEDFARAHCDVVEK
jgi:hypothetical protein